MVRVKSILALCTDILKHRPAGYDDQDIEDTVKGNIPKKKRVRKCPAKDKPVATMTGTAKSTHFGSGVDIPQSGKEKRRATDDAQTEDPDGRRSEEKTNESIEDGTPPKKRGRGLVDKFSYYTRS